MILASATGFLFPFEKLLPSHIVGIIALVVALVARYSNEARGALARRLRHTSVVALSFNVFVLVGQSFLKVGPLLHALAPNGNEPPFAVALRSRSRGLRRRAVVDSRIKAGS